MTKKIIIDLDNTITIHDPTIHYSKMPVNEHVAKRLREFHAIGYQITIFTARNMKTFEGNIELIEEITLPVIFDWLNDNNVPYDNVIVGKPWCSDGFYVDDKAIRPSEFTSLSESELLRLVNE
jgi:capsule biosynthesis phosphatase